MKPALVCSLGLSLLTWAAAQQPGDGAAVKADRNIHQVVVTAIPRRDEGEPIERGSIVVQQSGKNDNVRDWQPVNSHTTVDLAIIMDEDTQNIGVQLGDVKKFITELPPNVRVGVGYMSAGAILFTQSAFTPDRNLVLLKLRLPSGGGNSSPSPYGSVQYLMQKWHPRPNQIHEMLMISDGVEHLGGGNTQNITLRKAVADAVQAGVVVYAIAAPGPSGAVASADGEPPPLSGPPDASFQPRREMPSAPAAVSSDRGIINLNELTDATGGVTYSGGNGTPARFTDFLQDLLQRLNHQYLLTFESAKAPSGIVPIKIEVRAPDEKVTAPKQIVIAN
ncbi:MAG TPA: hypothetical protein VN709_08010 [Terriglobales bacterium]|nr:hypothetical protein [Terriglobales bacterium]